MYKRIQDVSISKCFLWIVRTIMEILLVLSIWWKVSLNQHKVFRIFFSKRIFTSLRHILYLLPTLCNQRQMAGGQRHWMRLDSNWIHQCCYEIGGELQRRILLWICDDIAKWKRIRRPFALSYIWIFIYTCPWPWTWPEPEPKTWT